MNFGGNVAGAVISNLAEDLDQYVKSPATSGHLKLKDSLMPRAVDSGFKGLHGWVKKIVQLMFENYFDYLFFLGYVKGNSNKSKSCIIENIYTFYVVTTLRIKEITILQNQGIPWKLKWDLYIFLVWSSAYQWNKIVRLRTDSQEHHSKTKGRITLGTGMESPFFEN